MHKFLFPSPSQTHHHFNLSNPSFSNLVRQPQTQPPQFGNTTPEIQQKPLLVPAAISNGDNLSPFIRKSFAQSKPGSLLHILKLFACSKESEIESVCKAHYQDFICAVDDLKSLLSEVDSLKSSTSNSNSTLQSTAQPLLRPLDLFLEASSIPANLENAHVDALQCIKISNLCSRANKYSKDDNLYLALKTVDLIEDDVVEDLIPLSSLKSMLTKMIRR